MYLNRIRISGDIAPVPFDDRAYRLLLPGLPIWQHPSTWIIRTQDRQFSRVDEKRVRDSARGSYHRMCIRAMERYSYGIEGRRSMHGYPMKETGIGFLPIDSGAMACSRGK